MAKTWLSVTVKLLGGRGEDLWPVPGRTFAVGPAHTFMDLANAINDAFARWDRAHLSQFTLADGTLITDQDSGMELAASPFGPLLMPVDIETAKVARLVKPGDEFQFVFDLGDDWVHRCVLAEGKIDPRDELGIQPAKPLPYWGWGSIPDQYGRRWADDDGSAKVPQPPSERHPMSWHAWPDQDQIPELDATAVCSAIARSDPGGLLAAILGRNIDNALQLVGAGMPVLLNKPSDQIEALVFSVLNRLNYRGGPGDAELAEDLLARLRGEPLPGRALPVELEMLSMYIEGESAAGGYVDLRTGDVYGTEPTDPAIVGEDVAIDVDGDPERWQFIEPIGSRPGWGDMADFIERITDIDLRDKLTQAIGGNGAFREFRDLIESADLGDQWQAFSADRQRGRARVALAGAGIRVGSESGR